MPIKRLLFSVFFVITLMSADVIPDARFTNINDPCASISASVVVTQKPDQLAKASVRMTGAQQPVRYFFSDAKGELLSEEYKKSEVDNLKPGKYTCLIKDAGGCRKKIEFEVK